MSCSAVSAARRVPVIPCFYFDINKYMYRETQWIVRCNAPPATIIGLIPM